jgi:HEAT repeat protein
VRHTTLLALLLLAGCSKSAPATSFELKAVSSAALAAVSKPPEPPAPDRELVTHLREQIADRAHLQGKLRALALSDIVATPDAAIAAADALLSDASVSDEAKRSALEVLGGIDTPASAKALAKRIDIQTSHAPWIRATAAFEVGRLSSDAVIPELCAQLKYETDGDTVVWIAALLAKHKNFCGLDGLRVLSVSGLTPEVQDHARSMLAQIASDAGFTDADALYAAWNSADPERKVPREEPSPELRTEIWRRVAALRVFDLKLVDDARFVLSRSPWWVIDVLVAALHEEVPQLRTCVAQSLERMGARASAACPELVRALDEPRMAPAVATALAGIGCRDALEPLVRCTQKGRDAELRHAAARALGVLGSQPAIDALAQLFAKADTADLRQTAAESLVGLGQGALGAQMLVECLAQPGADHDTAETALELWLDKSARDGNAAAKEALEAWRALAGDPRETPTVAKVTERHKARAELMRARLPALLPAPK